VLRRLLKVVLAFKRSGNAQQTKYQRTPAAIHQQRNLGVLSATICAGVTFTRLLECSSNRSKITRFVQTYPSSTLIMPDSNLGGGCHGGGATGCISLLQIILRRPSDISERLYVGIMRDEVLFSSTRKVPTTRQQDNRQRRRGSERGVGL
jgi:hypothetical protein